MHVLFENNIDEIPQVIQTTKKNKNSIFFEFKHTKSLKISRFNDQMCDLSTCVNASLFMQLISKEGYMIEGYSNRLYLSDVMSRLYQTLENLLKTNKGHKVSNKIGFDALRTTSNTKQKDKSTDHNTFDTSILTGFLDDIYNSTLESVRKDKNIYLCLSGTEEHFLCGNSNGEKFNTEEISFSINGEVYNKSNSSIIKKFTKKLLLKDLKSKETFITKFANEISKHSKELEI
jgi:hypothetical protein